jgi:hypothetical protein
LKTAPLPIGRCPLDRFCWERDLKLQDLAAAWGCSHEHARKICLPFRHPDRRPPSPELIERIFDWSGGEIRSADHYPPRLAGAPAAMDAVEETAP